MAILTKSQLASHVGVTSATITNNCQNNKLVVSVQNGKTVIDTDHPQNKKMIAHWLDGKKVVQSTSPTVVPSPVDELAERKKKVELDIQEMKLANLKFERSKSQGEYIPISLIASVFTVLGSSFQSSYKNGAETLLEGLFHEAKVPDAIAAKYRGKLYDLINSSHSNSIKNAKSSIKAIMDDKNK